MTTEITAWECELKTKETENTGGPIEVLETNEKKNEQTITTTTTETATSSTATNNKTSIASATNTPKKQKLVHFNKS